jgi:hypothetical protein
MDAKEKESEIRRKYLGLCQIFTEKQRRIWAASEAILIGYGGVSIVHKATGISRPTIHAGMKEFQKYEGTDNTHENLIIDEDLPSVRKSGGGRKTINVNAKTKEIESKLNKDIKDILLELVESSTKGDPQAPLLWTSKSTYKLAHELQQRGFQISAPTVSRLLQDMNYTLQANSKSIAKTGKHPNRDAQFEYINDLSKEFQKDGQPVISIDTKKKELIGNFKNQGREWSQKDTPLKVNDHDFMDEELGKIIPYGVYDIFNNIGWVNVGVDHDTAEFAIESLRRWWKEMGLPIYPKASRLLITADSGGSNSARGRLWKIELQKLANELGLEISVCHFPPGTSKWNRIEHQMFSHITKNWRARPLVSREVVISLISNTKTKKGLKIKAALDVNTYEIGKKVTDKELEEVNISYSEVNKPWNYTVKPINSTS